MNVSFLYMKKTVPNDNILYEVIRIKNGSTYEDLCRSISVNTSFIISGVLTKNARKLVGLMINITQLPMIQLKYDINSFIINNTCINEDNSYCASNVSQNYAIELIPAINIFYYSFQQLLPHLPFQNDVAIIYDFTVNEMRTNLTFFIKNIKMINASLIEASNDRKSIIEQLSILSQMYKTLIFMCQTSTVESYIIEAEQYFTENIFTWIIFTTDVMPFKCLDCITVDMFWIRIHHKKRLNTIYYIKDFINNEGLTNQFNETLKTFNYVQVSTYFEIFLAAYNFINVTYFEKVISNNTSCYLKRYWEKHPMKSAVFDLENYKSPDYGEYLSLPYNSFILYQDVGVRIYKINRRRDLQEGNINKYLGNWTFSSGIVMFYQNFTVDIYLLKHYRIGAIIQPPFTEWGNENENNIKLLEGYCIDLLNLIQNDLQFNYTLYLVEDGLFGSMDDNGVWNGVVGDIVSGNADFSISALSVMAEREIDIDYTVPYYDLVGTTILMKKTVVDNSLFKFLQVFELPVWLAVLGAYCLTSLLIWIFDIISPYSFTNLTKNNENLELENRRKFTPKECLWFCMTSLTPQGGGETPLNISGRFLSATWWVFGFIIIATYTANLAAFLTVSRLEQPISSLDDLANQYKIEYAPLKGSASEAYFKRMALIEEKFYNIWKEISLNESMNSMDKAKLAVWDYPVSEKFSNLWRIMQQSKLPDSTKEAINRVLTSENGFAFIGDALDIQYAVLTNCDLQTIGNEFSRKPFALGVQTGHPIKDKLSTSILRLLHQRKLETLKQKWWDNNPNKAKCPTTSDSNYGIKIENIGGVFIVILAGIIMAIVTLIIEYIYHHRMMQKSINIRESNTSTTIQMSNISTSNENDAFEDVEISEHPSNTILRHRTVLQHDNT
uniref:PBPe domain-containing protein n=1 Tax=Parastrongyloides trichosuri TaxID=131310 RepID=A0A0N4ZCL6_PARTI